MPDNQEFGAERTGDDHRYYLGIAEKDQENWAISFYAFPEPVKIGDTLPELIMHARDALASAIDEMQGDGRNIPEGIERQKAVEPDLDLSVYENYRLVIIPAEVDTKSIRINVTMDEGLVERLDSMAARAHSSRSAILARGARLVLASDRVD